MMKLYKEFLRLKIINNKVTLGDMKKLYEK